MEVVEGNVVVLVSCCLECFSLSLAGDLAFYEYECPGRTESSIINKYLIIFLCCVDLKLLGG